MADQGTIGGCNTCLGVPFGAARSLRRIHSRRFTVGAFAVAAALTMGANLMIAPVAVADDSANLASQVASARGGCPPLMANPVLTDLARRANAETRANIEHTARSLPFEDPTPLLHDLGYPASKSKLLSGYADDAEKAARGSVLFGWDTLPDCSYTEYGLDLYDGSANGYWLSSVIIAGTS